MLPTSPQAPVLIHPLERHISAPRFAPYLSHAGSSARAVALYRWGGEMSGALHESLGHVEVAMRNAIDRELRAWNASRPPALRHGVSAYSTEWLATPAQPLWGLLNPRRGGIVLSTYATALRRAEACRADRDLSHPRRTEAITHDDVVAQVSLGTWIRLLPDPGAPAQKQRTQQVLWTNALQHAFPFHADPAVVHYWASRLHRLRNRVAHHEPVIGHDLRGYHRTMARLLRAIDPDLGDWYSGSSRIPELLARRPI